MQKKLKSLIDAISVLLQLVHSRYPVDNSYGPNLCFSRRSLMKEVLECEIQTLDLLVESLKSYLFTNHGPWVCHSGHQKFKSNIRGTFFKIKLPLTF